MYRGLQKRPETITYSFEKWPDESDDEYLAFTEYCHMAAAVTPREFLLAQGHGELIVLAEVRGWIQRKDAYNRWMDAQRRQQAMHLLDDYLVSLKARLPYAVQREEILRKRDEEVLQDEEADPKTISAMRRNYLSARRDVDDNILLLLKVAKAMEPDSGINIQNIVGQIPAAQGRIESMAQSWGDPAGTTPESS